MQIDKNQIIDFLKSKGDLGKAEQADKELPDSLDSDKDGGLLSKLGIDIGALLGGLGGLGGIGKLLGKD